MTAPETFGVRPLRHLPNKRLRNMLMSVVFCGGLFIAYYHITDKTPIFTDSHITYDSAGAFRLDLGADGQVHLTAKTGDWHYRISPFALRRVLRAFHHADFMNRDLSAYNNTQARCTLGLTENHQKMAIRHDCDTQAVEITGPIQALETTTRFRKVLKGDKHTLRDFSLQNQ